MSYPRVVVTGLGAVTPVGNNKNDYWASLVAGKSGVGRITSFDPHQFDAQIAGEVKGYDPKDSITMKVSRRMELFSKFAVTAAQVAF
jgi:3-oxoacyl-[acyl-carrier-protein] synthase II